MLKTSRQMALDWLLLVINKGMSINEVLAKDYKELADDQRSLAKQILFGCVRYYHQLDTVLANLLVKPLRAKDADIKLALVMGLYQLKYLSTPDHAAISESVELSRYLNKQWATALINGVLRRYQRESGELNEKLAKSQQFQYSHPGWMVKQIKQDWGDNYAQILAANNQQAPMVLRVNTLKNTRDEYLQKLSHADLKAIEHPVAIDGIILEQAKDVNDLPEFNQGSVTVQDGSAQLAVELLQLKPQQKVLDACAAPGGKTTHILQRQNRLDLDLDLNLDLDLGQELIAVEKSAARAEKIEQTLIRMQLKCKVICADITEIKNWWDGELFDRILLDVPCSASGVIRRNPDIKVHRKVTDIKPLVELQAKILNTAWQILKPNGILVYATCSVFKQENEAQIENFLNQHEAEILTMPIEIESKLEKRAAVGYQIFPSEWQMDGFYLCGLKKLK